MIRRKDKKVIIPQFLQEDTQILVEPFDLFSVTHRIPAVSQIGRASCRERV